MCSACFLIAMTEPVAGEVCKFNQEYFFVLLATYRWKPSKLWTDLNQGTYIPPFDLTACLLPLTGWRSELLFYLPCIFPTHSSAQNNTDAHIFNKFLWRGGRCRYIYICILLPNHRLDGGLNLNVLISEWKASTIKAWLCVPYLKPVKM